MRQSTRARRNTFLKLPLVVLLLVLALGTCEDGGGSCGGGDCGGGDCGSSESTDSGGGCDGGDGEGCSDSGQQTSESSSCSGSADYVCYDCGSSRPVPAPAPPPGDDDPPPVSNTLVLVSDTSGGTDGHSGAARLSSSANYVAFESEASNLTGVDGNGASDVFLYLRSSNAFQLISQNMSGASGNGPSMGASISADGDIVSFESAAGDLVPSDPNGAASDLFVYERSTSTLLRVGLSTDGFGPNAGISEPEVSADGSAVAFSSVSTNLIANDDNGSVRDIFVVRLATGNVELVSVSIDANGANGPSSSPDISNTGRYVVFESEASDLVSSDPNSSVSDIFLFDTQGATMQLVSTSDADEAANGACHAPAISNDGRFIAFHSVATTLDGTDGNGGTRDIYQYDRFFDELIRISESATGGAANGASGYPRYSSEGTFLVFESFASNIVSTDTNGSVADVFIRDQVSGNVAALSTRGGETGDGHSLMPAISPDGAFVVFESFAEDLHSEDDNGATGDVFLANNPLD